MTASTRALTGALDVARAAELHAIALESAGTVAGDVVFDCMGVERIDAAGAQVLVALGRALEARGAKLELIGLSEAVSGLLVTAGLGSVLGIGRAAAAAVTQDEERDQGREKEQVERA